MTDKRELTYGAHYNVDSIISSGNSNQDYVPLSGRVYGALVESLGKVQEQPRGVRSMRLVKKEEFIADLRRECASVNCQTRERNRQAVIRIGVLRERRVVV